MGRYKAFGNIGNYRLSAKQARKLGRPWMAQVAVGVDFMSDEDKAAMGIADGVVMAKKIVHRGEVIATNVPLSGIPKAKRKPT